MKAALRLLLAPYRFSVDRLFRMGEIGGAHWFDSPSLYPGGNHLYLYQDSAGASPVTAVGQTIGLSLDRAYGGMRGANSWNPASVSLSGESSQVSIGVYRIYSSAGALSFVSGGTTVVGRLYEVQFTIDSITTPGAGVMVGDSGAIFTTTGRKTSVWLANLTFAFIKRNAAATDIQISNVSVREIPGTHLIQATGTARPTLSARVNLLLNTATMSTQNVTTVATSYKLSFTGTGTVTLSGTSTDGPLVGTGANDRVSLTFTPTAGTLTLTVSGSVTLADLRTADDAAKNIPAYQRVGATAADHDTDGFPHYALFDGTDDSWASAATVDGSATDKVTVVAGVTKNSDAAAGMIAELSTSVAANNGSFLVLASGVYAGGDRLTYAAETRGTVATAYREVRPFTAPHSAVLTFALDNGASTPATQATGRVNGAAITGNVGTGTTAGNFGNHTLYVGSRAGSSIRFNGRLYSLVPRFGAMGEADLNRLERWTKNLMRLP